MTLTWHQDAERGDLIHAMCRNLSDFISRSCHLVRESWSALVVAVLCAFVCQWDTTDEAAAVARSAAAMCLGWASAMETDRRKLESENWVNTSAVRELRAKEGLFYAYALLCCRKVSPMSYDEAGLVLLCLVRFRASRVFAQSSTLLGELQAIEAQCLDQVSGVIVEYAAHVIGDKPTVIPLRLHGLAKEGPLEVLVARDARMGDLQRAAQMASGAQGRLFFIHRGDILPTDDLTARLTDQGIVSDSDVWVVPEANGGSLLRFLSFEMLRTPAKARHSWHEARAQLPITVSLLKATYPDIADHSLAAVHLWTTDLFYWIVNDALDSCDFAMWPNAAAYVKGQQVVWPRLSSLSKSRDEALSTRVVLWLRGVDSQCDDNELIYAIESLGWSALTALVSA
eukprot:m51a1_g1986 hypothetical protein (398) ;mRNA; r:1165952-1167542